MTTGEAALVLKVDKRHVSRLCKEGELRGAQKIGRDWLIPRSEVERYRREVQGKSTNRNEWR